MNKELEQNLLSLPKHALNSEIEDLQARISYRISIALQYVSKSWHNHLTETAGDIADVIPYLRIFLEEKFLAWLEVLGVLGDVGSASVALEKLIFWLQEVCFVALVKLSCVKMSWNQVAKDSQLRDTAQDYLHFVAKFFEPINASATHIYHSALELCPASSIV